MEVFLDYICGLGRCRCIMSKSVSNLISVILNGLSKNQLFVYVHKSKFAFSILNILKNEGFLMDITDSDRQYYFRVDLKYHNRKPVIKMLKMISHGSYRVYTKNTKNVPRNFEIRLLSTSQGIMTHMEATKRGIGGQSILEVF